MRTELTPREINIAKSICKNKTTKEIASDCDISDSTVEFHRENINLKLRTHGIAAVIKRCLQLNIISMEEFLKD